jgi:hypothetical protein
MTNMSFENPDCFIARFAPWLARFDHANSTHSEADGVIFIMSAAKESGVYLAEDPEQRLMMDLLLTARANEMVCKLAWSFYRDYVLIETNTFVRRPVCRMPAQAA